ncbi:ATP-dependent helicase [Zhihengliuella salsuginis]|uniref:ATP-dependent helicase Lhr n=1 Tax=Zhihengliuella salsuginis TaxID=578222 RepID=A0ABQ3GBD4_9MICC|nr:ATP-dependent helicase [Zhihengliuella salsuginis]GHD00565.1 putative ATP-dependent helicase Lhr [Zhihengliuella salsuginis]
MDRFTPATREWFAGAFAAPTEAQSGAWDAVSRGENALVVAPTGSGKTLSAFLWAIDSLVRSGAPEDAAPPGPAARAEQKRSTRVLYISPLKALGVDVERNLRSPLIGIAQTAARIGETTPEVRVGVRSGDTPANERRRLQTHPPDILITTPESLFLMLTSRARETLAGVDTVILDEVHAVAGTKRGAHLAVSLERLDALLAEPAQRIGLSATVEPHAEVARFLGGARPVTVVAPPSRKTWDLTVSVPVEDMTDLPAAAGAHDLGPASGLQPQASIWPHVEEQIVDHIEANRSTIVFANSRRLAERLTGRLNEIHADRLELAGAGPDEPAHVREQSGPRGGTRMPAEMMAQAGQSSGADPVLARAHHGSVSKEQRADIEDGLKSGRLRCVVATSSLELGIDMGLVDLVIQVESPNSVASGLQRVGRAGHQVGAASAGFFFPKHRGDLLETAVTVERMLAGRIEPLRIPANPLDILAQQTVAATALGEIDAEEWYDVVRRAAPFAALPRSAYEATLDLLAGKYPSDEFAELRPRIVWDRDAGTLAGRPGAQRLAVTSGGTIPDRGLFGVFIAGTEDEQPGSARTGGRRVGELDEEMVYESRVGDVFALGATSWKIEDITHDRVVVSPAFGQPGKLPFWRGDGPGRPVELGYAVGAFRREVAALDENDAGARLATAGLDAWAVANLRSYLAAQQEATGALPTDRALVVERFQDELGDWRVVLHSPFGMPVHAPWALAVGARLRERYGLDGSAMAADDGIVLRVPMMEDEPPGAELFEFDPDELSEIVTREVGGSALFASRFRECAARALLLPRQNPSQRSPLWQQRQRSAQLLDVAKKFPTFPIILETARECLQDVYDLDALAKIAGAVQSRSIRVLETTTRQPSPFAQSLLFGYVAQFLYEGDSPLAERRAAALSLDPTLLNDLLGRTELRELLDAGVITRTAAELQRTAEGYRLRADTDERGVEAVADLLRLLGPLDASQLAVRLDPEPAAEQAAAWAGALVRSVRALKVQVTGREVYAAVEDAARLRDALGVPLPIGVPLAFVEPVDDPLGDLVGRYARTHGPFTADEAAAALGLGVGVVRVALQRLGQDGRVNDGAFRPPELLADEHHTAAGHDGLDADSAGLEWCDTEVLRRIRRRSLAALRAEVEPVDPAAFARFLPEWQFVGDGASPAPALRGIDGVAAVLEQLACYPAPASAWESHILPSRVADYQPGLLDQLLSTGEVMVTGAGALAGTDGWLAFHPAATADLTLPAGDAAAPETTATQERLLETLSGGGAYFFRQLAEAAPDVPQGELVEALWELFFAGRVTNDTFAAVRGLLDGGRTAHRRRTSTPRARLGRPTRLGPRSGLRHRLGGDSPSGLRTGGNPADAQASTTGLLTPAQAAKATGRWSLVPRGEADPTIRTHATAELLLERYGVVTRGPVMSEDVAGGFALVYKVLAKLEESGQVRRGYFIEHLGAAQFALSSTIDRLRTHAGGHDDAAAAGPARRRHAVALAATDPANPYGAALPWPEPPPAASETAGTGRHRPGRKAGAVVVLVDGMLTLYLERGGKTMLSFSEEPAVLDAAATSLVGALKLARIEKLGIERVGGQPIGGTALADALRAAGFYAAPNGVRFRA